MADEQFEFTDEALAGLIGKENPEPEPEEGSVPPPGEVVMDDGRDERGRFTKKEEPEPEPEPEQEAGPEPILGKFKSQDDLVEAYQALEHKLSTTRADKDEFDQLKEQLEQMKSMLQPSTPSYDGSAVDRLIDEDPATATAISYQSGDTYRFREALSAWKDQDPFAAAVWVADIRRQAEMDQLRMEYEARIQSSDAETQNQQFSRAWRDVAQQYPDVENYAQDILEAAQQAPEIIQGLQSGTYSDKTRVIENLYWLAKGRKADSLAAAMKEAATEQKQEQRQEKLDAVVSGASPAQVPQEDKSPIELWQERLLAGPNTSIREGLTQ